MDKQFRSENSLQQFGEDEPTVSGSNKDKDPGDSAERLTKLILPSRDDGVSPAITTGDLSNPSPLFHYGNPSSGDVTLMIDLQTGTRSVATMDAQSMRSVESHAPLPTSYKNKIHLTKVAGLVATDDEIKKLQKCAALSKDYIFLPFGVETLVKHLTLVLSIIYAVLIVTLGIILYPADPFIRPTVASMYSIVLTAIGLVYQFCLILDINCNKSTTHKNQKRKGLHEENMAECFREQEEQYGGNDSGDRTSDNCNTPVLPSAVMFPIKHNYCFSQGRHSGSFYLKLGATGFAMGHLIHSLLLITVQLNYYLNEEIDNDKCLDMIQVVYDFLNPIYCFIQLYFIFNYSNVIISRGKGIAYFGFMHMIGSSLCFWMSTIVRETILALAIYASSKQNHTQVQDAFVDSKSEKTDTLGRNIFDAEGLYREDCHSSATVKTILENFSPYLYPFSVEFNILIVAFYYIIWSHIGQCDYNDIIEGSSDAVENTTACKIPTADEDNEFTNNIVISADCHASNKGVFFGLVFMVIVITHLIISYILSSIGGELLKVGYILTDCTKLTMHGTMLFAAVFAYNQIRKLDVNEHPMSLLDDVLLFICLPAFFMETVFSMVATTSILNIVKSADIMVMVIQAIVQTTLLIDGLRRCSNSKKLRRTKPGRELLMFLLIANVGMWLFNTFSFKSPDSLDERYAYYGKVLWTILGHVSLPLIMFYRFHSSVCFADIWDAAYKPSSHH